MFSVQRDADPAVLLYDAMYLYLLLINEAYIEGNNVTRNGRELFQLARGMLFEGEYMASLFLFDIVKNDKERSKEETYSL